MSARIGSPWMKFRELSGVLVRKRGDINSQIRDVMEVKTTGKRKKGQSRKSWKECVRKDLERYGLRREDAYNRKK